MPDPLMINGIQAGQVAGPLKPAVPVGPTVTPDGLSFKDTLLKSLEEVNRLQQDASAGVDKLMTGQTDDVASVFSAVRKADIAFSMLMEMRNKMIEAYQEVQQMRV
jgi:flagellar hook-basal body complex protein FliE